MTKENSMIASKMFFKKKNPTLWDGIGDAPDTFNMDPWTMHDPETSTTLSIRYRHITGRNEKTCNEYWIFVDLFDKKNELLSSMCHYSPHDIEKTAQCIYEVIRMAKL